MNTKEIKPVKIWTAKGEKIATILSLFNFTDYHFDNGSGKVSYKLIAMEGDPASAIDVVTGTVDIPSEIINQWGTDDNIIWAYVASSLNLTII